VVLYCNESSKKKEEMELVSSGIVDKVDLSALLIGCDRWRGLNNPCSVQRPLARVGHAGRGCRR